MTQQTNIVPATPEAIDKAASLLKAGRLVALPTETVYGLGADATNPEAVAGIFTAKGRPRFNPLIVHVATLDAARSLSTFTPIAEELAEALWPGPLTMILPRHPQGTIPDITVAGLSTIAIRIPSHPVAVELLIKANIPVAAPSANRSGHVSATTAHHVADDFGSNVSMILDAGPTPHGVESTVVDATGERPIILRPGAITNEAISEITCIGSVPPISTTVAAGKPTSPGQLESHYAPRSRVRLNATTIAAGERYLAFGPDIPTGVAPLANLSETGNLVEAAANLFAVLRQLDQLGGETIAVAPIPNTGIGEAINDRLRRAAAPRPDPQKPSY